MLAVGNLKVCSRCRVEKPVVSFGKDKSRSDGLQPWCRECVKANDKARNATPERKAYQKAWNATPERKAYQKAWSATPEGKAHLKANDAARRATPERKTYMKAYLKAYDHKKWWSDSKPGLIVAAHCYLWLMRRVKPSERPAYAKTLLLLADKKPNLARLLSCHRIDSMQAYYLEKLEGFRS